MAEPTGTTALHDNQPIQDQLGHPVHPWKATTRAHLTTIPEIKLLLGARGSYTFCAKTQSGKNTSCER
eukprot:scaffold130540_cov67-Attheya_sp.AAC.4